MIAYLGADVRKSTSNATFMIHKTYFSPPQATAERLQSAANAALLDDGRIESILHQDVKLSDEKWEISDLPIYGCLQMKPWRRVSKLRSGILIPLWGINCFTLGRLKG